MKQQRIKHKGMVVVLLMVLMMAQVIGVHAAESSRITNSGVVAFEEGSATLEIVGSAGQSLVGKTLQLHRLFDAENAKGMESIDYTLNPIYKTVLQTAVGNAQNKSAESVTEYEIIDFIQSMNSNRVEGADAELNPEGRYSDYRYFIENLAAEMERENLTGEQIQITNVNARGNIKITGLTYGYYMILDVSETEGKHTAASMPLLTTANPEITIRIKSDYPTVVQKLKEDEGDLWNDIGDYEIGQDITYRYQSNIPDIDGYHQYFYAWHTKTEEALTLKPDSVQIQIDHYQLQSSEYQIIQETSTSEFAFVIPDIKAIVDREFPGQTYHQQVTVTYLSTLNDKAALDTGRPGFENHVRLEFSNNPNQGGSDETGYTAWDTVVCFTYQLQGKKVNNYGANLEGASFRLYADEACENEILVQKIANRYHVMHENNLDEEKRTLSVAIVSDENGNFNISGLDGDTYYLKEVEAPAGYRPILDPIRVNVQAKFPENRDHYVEGEGAGEDVLQLSAKAYIKKYVDGAETEKEIDLDVNQEEGSMALAVVNEVGNLLPASGSYAALLIGAACIGLFIVSILRGKKKHE